MFGRSSFLRSCVHNKGRFLPKFERELSDQKARAMPARHTTFAWQTEFFCCSYFGISSVVVDLILIDDVTANVFLFTGSYSLIVRL